MVSANDSTRLRRLWTSSGLKVEANFRQTSSLILPLFSTANRSSSIPSSAMARSSLKFDQLVLGIILRLFSRLFFRLNLLRSAALRRRGCGSGLRVSPLTELLLLFLVLRSASPLLVGRALFWCTGFPAVAAYA